MARGVDFVYVDAAAIVVVNAVDNDGAVVLIIVVAGWVVVLLVDVDVVGIKVVDLVGDAAVLAVGVATLPQVADVVDDSAAQATRVKTPNATPQ